MAKIIKLSPGEVGDGVHIDPDQILSLAVGNGYTHVVVVACDANGQVDTRASHGLAESLLLIERAKAKMVGCANG